MDNPIAVTSHSRSQGERSLTATLDRLRGRAVRVGWIAGGVWGIVCGALWLLAGVWTDLVLQLSPGLRIGILASAVIAGGIVLSRRVRLALAQGSRGWLARRLDEVSGARGEISSGVSLTEAPGSYAYSARPALTAGLAQLAIHRAANLARGVAPAAAVPSLPLRRSLGVLAGLVAALLLLAAVMPNLTATEFRRFADPFGDHPPFTMIQFTVEPGDTQVTYGSGLDIHVTVEGPAVEALELVLRPLPPVDDPRAAETASSGGEEAIPMFPDKPGEWRASLSGVTRRQAYVVRAGSARSPRYTINVLTVPQIAEVLARVAPPEYTRLAATEGAVPAAGIIGLPGTQVTLSARSNRPLSGGTVTYVTRDGRREFPLRGAPSGSDTVAGTFPIAGSGRIEVRVADVAGQSSTEEWTAPVTELADEQPFVRLLEPRAVSFATPTAIIPVVASAEDDYGIARLQLFRSLNDSRALPDELPVASPPPRRVYQVTRLPLELYGLEPGDEIKLFARVEDNDPRGNSSGGEGSGVGKGAESPVAVIRIISHEQFEQMRETREGMDSLLAKYQEARRRLESLGEEVAALRKELQEQSGDEAAMEKTRAALERLSQRFEEEAEALRKLGEKKHPFPIDNELTEELERARDSVERLQKRTAELAAQTKLTPEELEQALQELADELREDRERFDQEAMQPLETLAAIARLTEDESRFEQLYERQRDLAERLASLKGKDKVDDPAVKGRMRDLEEEQRRIRLELDDLLNDIEEHAAQLPDDQELDDLRTTALEFAEDVRASGATEAMLEAESSLAEFSGTRGHEGALEAADILERFLDKAQEMGGEGGACCRKFRPRLADAMRQTLAQMARGMGSGSGQGDGFGGYSARRANVGLYGDSPTADPGSGGREGQSSRNARDRGGRGGAGGRNLSDDDAPHDAEGALRAGGANDAAIPLRYRRQVGRYFQRIADELDEK